MNLDEYHKTIIKEEADRIRAKLIGGAIFGIRIEDGTDIDMLIAAAYHVGMHEAHTERTKRIINK